MTLPAPYYQDESVTLYCADALAALRELPEASVQTCVTSPPYWGLRDYGTPGQLGLEGTPEEYVAKMVEVFGEVRRVLRDDGTLWLNLGDSYAGSWSGNSMRPSGGTQRDGGPGFQPLDERVPALNGVVPPGLRPKNLVGIPWRVAFALQADGWYLRQWMPWLKRNPMPESVRDRPTSAVEIIFLLSKGGRYFYDYDAVSKKIAPTSLSRLEQDVASQAGSDRANGGAKINGPMKAVRRTDKQRGHGRRHDGFNDRWDAMTKAEQCETRAFRNADLFYRSLSAPHGMIGNEDGILAFDVTTQPYPEAHFATFPPDLVKPCVLAGAPVNGMVLDPFMGSGTTAWVAKELGRKAIGIDLNASYLDLAARRLRQEVLG